MSVKIRLKRMGAMKRPFYRIIVADSRAPRDGRFIDTLGYYNPCVEPIQLKIDAERAKLWLSRGAQPSDTAGALLKKEGLLAREAARPSTKKAAAPEATAESVKTAAPPYHDATAARYVRFNRISRVDECPNLYSQGATASSAPFPFPALGRARDGSGAEIAFPYRK